MVYSVFEHSHFRALHVSVTAHLALPAHTSCPNVTACWFVFETASSTEYNYLQEYPVESLWLTEVISLPRHDSLLVRVLCLS